MRNPITDDEDKQEATSLESKAENARAMKSNASIKSKDAVEELNDEQSLKQDKLKLIIGGGGKFSKDSKTKKIFSFKMNFYEKAALYIYAKKHDITMQESLETASLNEIVKSSEEDGLDEKFSESLHKKKLIK